MRKSSFAPGILFLIFALTLPVLIIAQQTRSARRTTTPDRPTPTGTASGKANPTGAMVKSDIAEALSVIQSNHIDGRKLDYNEVFVPGAPPDRGGGGGGATTGGGGGGATSPPNR